MSSTVILRPSRCSKSASRRMIERTEKLRTRSRSPSLTPTSPSRVSVTMEDLEVREIGNSRPSTPGRPQPLGSVGREALGAGALQRQRRGDDVREAERLGRVAQREGVTLLPFVVRIDDAG